MKRKSVAVSLITVLLYMLLGSTIACAPSPVQTFYDLTLVARFGGELVYNIEGYTEDWDCPAGRVCMHLGVPRGRVVAITAVPDEGFAFADWTGDVDAIADVNAATTAITMSGNYTIVANFIREIRDWHDLDAIRENLDLNCVLISDLDSTTAGYEELAGPNANGGKGWQPIGTVATGENWMWYYPFTGSLDGRGYEIRDFFINRPEESHIGLFGYIREGVITDVGVVNVTVTGLRLVGGLVGWNEDGTVNNSYAAGSVTGTGRVGGLVGDNWGIVGNCYATADVTGQSSVGGLVGRNYGTVSNSYYDYDRVLINEHNVITTGALFGEDFEEWLANGRFLDITERLSREEGYYVINDASDLKQLLAFGQDGSLKFRLKNDLDLAGEPGLYIPYLAAEFDGNGHKISNVSFGFDFASQVGLFGFLATTGIVSDVGLENVSLTGHEDVGGLMGRNNGGTVSNAYATGSVTGGTNVGGLAGRNAGTMSNSYASVNVTGNEYVGGLVGDNYGPVSNCYSTGGVTGGSSAGGLVQQGFGTVSNSFWDIEASGQTASAGGTGKNTTEMQDINTFTDTATEGLDDPWDIISVTDPDTRNSAYIWNIVDGETYPFLSWQPVS